MSSELSSDDVVTEAASNEGPKWYSDALVWGVFVLVFAADQVTKAIVTSNLHRGESWPDDGFARITYARNTGTAFGLFPDQGVLLTIVSLLAVAGMIYFFRGASLRNWTLRLAIGLMLGGALGNLVDRIRLGFVVDFVDLGAWPIFNIADSSIVVGIATLATMTILFPDKLGAARGQQVEPAGEAPGPDETVDADDEVGGPEDQR